MTHELLQLVVPPGHAVVHAPPAHTSLAPQALAQLPQWALSDCSFTHAPLQLVYPALQAMPHVPPAHTAVPFAGGGQALLQAPQFWVSSDTLRHWFWHGT